MAHIVYRSHWSSLEAIHIMIALAEGSTTRAELENRLIANSIGRVYVPPTSLYRWLRIGQAKGYIEIVGPIRRFPQVYQLTPPGRRYFRLLARSYRDTAKRAMRYAV